MPYEISIIKIKTVTRNFYKNVIIGEEPTTIEDKNNSYAPETLPALKSKYGNILEPRECEEKVKILEQVVDELDLATVIKAINKL